jgi:hypothetical protein
MTDVMLKNKDEGSDVIILDNGEELNKAIF